MSTATTVLPKDEKNEYDFEIIHYNKVAKMLPVTLETAKSFWLVTVQTNIGPEQIIQTASIFTAESIFSKKVLDDYFIRDEKRFASNQKFVILFLKELTREQYDIYNFKS